MISCHIKNDESAVLKMQPHLCERSWALQNRKEITLFYKVNESGYKQVLPGIKLKTLVYGEKTLFSEFRMEADSTLPKHSHPHEQTGYLVKGKIRLTIGQETLDVGPGDSWCIPGHTEHSAEILEYSVAIEVFSPVREEYLPENSDVR